MTRRRSLFMAAAMVALSLTASLVAQSRPAGIEIDNFAEVNPTYYRGAQPEDADYKALAALGVKTVIALTSYDAQDDERQFVEGQAMRYVHIHMHTRKPPSAAELEAFLTVVNDPANQPVYVHCVGGRHRTGVMTAVYRMTRDGLSGPDAFDEMKQFKYGPDFLHPEFKSFVKSFDPATLTSSQR